MNTRYTLTQSPFFALTGTMPGALALCLLAAAAAVQTPLKGNMAQVEIGLDGSTRKDVRGGRSSAVPLKGNMARVEVGPARSTRQDVRGGPSSAVDAGDVAAVREISCQCTPTSDAWAPPTSRAAKTVYFDLGANKGDTFPPNATKLLVDTTRMEWDCSTDLSFLFEANPAFTQELKTKAATCGDATRTTVFAPSAVACCDGQAKLYISPSDVGSTTSKNKTQDVDYASVAQEMPAVNLMRVLHEQTLEGDTVVLKMDIEGGEFDIIPCLAESPAAKNIDWLLLERHDGMMKLTSETIKQFNEALEKLRGMGVQVNDKWP